MNNLFERTSSNWVRYDNYEWKKDQKGYLYLTPASVAKPDIYDPLRDAQALLPKVALHHGTVDSAPYKRDLLTCNCTRY